MRGGTRRQARHYRGGYDPQDSVCQLPPLVNAVSARCGPPARQRQVAQTQSTEEPTRHERQVACRHPQPIREQAACQGQHQGLLQRWVTGSVTRP